MAKAEINLIELLDRLQAVFTPEIVIDACRAWRMTEYGSQAQWSKWLISLWENGLIKKAGNGHYADHSDAEFQLLPTRQKLPIEQALTAREVRVAVEKRRRADWFATLVSALVKTFGEREFTLEQARKILPRSPRELKANELIRELVQLLWLDSKSGKKRLGNHHTYRLRLHMVPVKFGGRRRQQQKEEPKMSLKSSPLPPVVAEVPMVPAPAQSPLPATAAAPVTPTPEPNPTPSWPSTPDRELMADIVCEYFEISRGYLMGQSQRRWVSYARHVLMHLLSFRDGRPQWEIGLFVGRRSNQVVNYAYHRITEMASNDPEVAADLQEIKRRFRERKLTSARRDPEVATPALETQI